MGGCNDVTSDIDSPMIPIQSQIKRLNSYAFDFLHKSTGIKLIVRTPTEDMVGMKERLRISSVKNLVKEKLCSENLE